MPCNELDFDTKMPPIATCNAGRKCMTIGNDSVGAGKQSATHHIFHILTRLKLFPQILAKKLYQIRNMYVIQWMQIFSQFL